MDSKDNTGAGAGLVSMKPLNQQNAPDKWQKKGLKSFREGRQEVSAIQKKGAVSYLRLMQPLEVRKECLRCHGGQGYSVGDIRGGISLSMPVSRYEKSLQKDMLVLRLAIALVWLAGACTTVILGQQLTRRVREREKLESRLQYLSFHDSLTGLYNRFAFDYEMERLQKGRYDSICIIVCDVDGLKKVNDEHGHVEGYSLLKYAAENIAACLREGDLVARIGGDKFAVLITDTDEQECCSLIDRIRSRIEEFNSKDEKLQLSLSMGCAHWAGTGQKDLQNLFKKADDLMYKDKTERKAVIA